jgi:hypothetical protein
MVYRHLHKAFAPFVVFGVRSTARMCFNACVGTRGAVLRPAALTTFRTIRTRRTLRTLERTSYETGVWYRKVRLWMSQWS